MVCLSERQRRSWNWLMMSDLKRESVRLTVSAQDLAQNTNSHIYLLLESDKCRLCGKMKTVTYVIKACEMLTQREYRRHHDKVCSHQYWCLCQHYGSKLIWLRHCKSYGILKKRYQNLPFHN